MMNFDPIFSIARNDLVIITATGEQDVFLWEHSSRVARSAQLIAQLPVVQAHLPDEFAVVAAGLYHDASWAIQYREGEIERTEILRRPTSKAHRQRGVALMEQSLAELAPEESLERAADTIRALNERDPELVEAQVIADAENLDEFGMLAFCPAILRSAHEGKGVQAAIDTWQRKKEYQFWTARLNESFRFDPVRELARKRLAQYERAMQDLDEHHRGADIPVAHSGQELAHPSPSRTR
ncbi:MAG: HD domain-containing protein [Phycisphaerales bacterium]|nr:MAG: HD domain-containing protein [Phycisphaerales bacterium]